MSCSRRTLILACVLGVVTHLGGAAAQSQPLEVKVGHEIEFQLPRQPQIIDVEHHDIATLALLPDGRARVRGVAVGATRIIGRDFGDLPMIFAVRVIAP